MSDEKGSSYRGFTEAQARAHRKYIAQFVEMKVRTTPARRDAIQNAAAAVGQSVNAYINQAIDERMTRESPSNAAVSPSEGAGGGGATPIPSAQDSGEGA